jgi:hypothetical protein
VGRLAGPITALALVSLLVLPALGCAGRSFSPAGFDLSTLRSRAIVQEDAGAVRVLAAVPSAEETRQIFGAPLYERGIQPIWLEVQNLGAVPLRFAPVGTDPDYFAPLEVAYMHRGGLSKRGLADMERSYRNGALPREIPASQTRSGFVFTHLSPGTKGFNVDLFPSDQGSHLFTFFVEVPGFTPDHAHIDFDRLYSPSELRAYDPAGLRAALAPMDCCTEDASGQMSGAPLNVVFVGTGDDVLHSLLRAGWHERPRPKEGRLAIPPPHWSGRKPDAVFRKTRSKAGERNELALWLTPWRLDGQPVWVAQVTHHVTNLLGLSFLDPDIDDARLYLAQDLWYSQGLAKVAWVAGPQIVSIDAKRRGLWGSDYFTDGHRGVFWVSSKPVSLTETEILSWDALPE